MGFSLFRTRAAMPGDDLLFQCLSNSTIGAVWFHGRVRDGIGWVTDAMVTKQWSRCAGLGFQIGFRARLDIIHNDQPRAVVDGGTHQARIGQLVSVSSTRYRASTSDLSRSWSPTVLRNLISREASRLDAFSGYPVHT